MGNIIAMPRVDPAMEKGVVLKILKKVGDKVTKNEPVLKVMTEKATFEVNSPYEGFVARVFHKEGEELNVGEPILEISETLQAEQEIYEKREETFEKQEEAKEILATPAARRLAREHGLDLSKITGTGPQGRITQEDVLQYLSQIKSEAKETALSPIRKIIAQRVEKSHKEIPQLTVNVNVIVDKLLNHRSEHGISFDSYFIFCASRALKEYPIFNSEFRDGIIQYKKEVNIAFALAIGEELYMPVIKNADLKSVEEIDREHHGLIEKAKNAKLELKDLQDYTFSITNLGVYNVTHFNPLIYPPNTAILGIGCIEYKIFNEGPSFSIKPTITLSLSFDHRVADGMQAALFLNKIKEMIENGRFE